MFRRLATLILALTCAFAPAVSAFELNLAATDDCCCGTTCPCPPTDCAPAPSSPLRSAQPGAAAAVEQRAEAARPRARLASAFFLHFLSAPPPEPALRVRPLPSARLPADGVALYEAHCSFLI